MLGNVINWRVQNVNLHKTMKKVAWPVSLFSIILIFAGCASEVDVTPEEAREIAKEAYIYGFPMVVNYKTMYKYALDENSPEYRGPFNYLSCSARLYTP